MQLRNFLLFILGLSLLPMMGLSQGTLRGKVNSGTDGEPLVGAVIRLIQEGNVKGGAYSDLDGAFQIQAAAGSYDLIISYVSFVVDTMTQVAITEGEVTLVQSILYETNEIRKDLEVTITAKRNKASTVTLFHQKKNAINTIDGVTTDLIKRTGDVDVASAMQRVSGVTVEGGKYVMVRGLGDRYSKATLNSAVLPNLDPNRNSVQLDVIPSSMIDNILVYKTFTPDLPGDFSGGLVNIVTKDFPDKLKVNVSASLSYNPQANLINDFNSYQTGSRDWLGLDDGTRNIPDVIAPNGGAINIPERSFNDIEQAQLIDAQSKSFQTGMDPVTKRSFLTQNYQASIGNQFMLGGKPLGFIAGFSYRNDYDAYNGFVDNNNYRVARWKNTGVAGSPPPTSLLLLREHKMHHGQQNILWGAMGKLSYKPWNNHRFSFTYMHNQSGNSMARSMEGPLPDDAPDLIFQTRVISWLERSLDAFQLEGKHQFGKLKSDWIASYTLSGQKEPDLRFFSNDYVEGPDGERNYNLQPSIYPEPNRFWRELEETNVDARLNFELPFKQWSDKEGFFKFGGAYTSKDREFVEQRINIARGNISARYNGDPEAYFSDENSGIRLDTFMVGGNDFVQINYKNFVQNASEARNAYSGSQKIWAGYGMVKLPLFTRMDIVAGIRFESTHATTISADSSIANGVLDLQDFLPSISAKYALTDQMNLRGGYTKTLARPTFREFSPFASFDFVGDFILKGNPNLKRTLIDNIDLRWEWYPSPGELISVSGFYKKFTNPIERVLVPEAQNLELTYNNVGQALVYGIELEFRFDFGFITEKAKNFLFTGNLALLTSEVDIDPREYQAIVAVDPDRPPTRQLMGQSPYSVNAELAYINDKLGLQSSLSYNVFGPRLTIVGGPNPDVFEQPRGLLNFAVRKTIGKHWSVRFRARNLLNPASKWTQEYRGEEYIYQVFKTGTSFSIGLAYNL